MKLHRQLYILTVLACGEKATAPELAEKLEVSRRTITRDIDDLCQAGFPIYTVQGRNGGIYLTDGYTIPEQGLTEKELSKIQMALTTLSSIEKSSELMYLMEKVLPRNRQKEEATPFAIDLASFYADSLSEKIEILVKGIQNKEKVSFDYYTEKGKQQRHLHPYRLFYQWRNWYIWGYCELRASFRLFKLARLWALKPLVEHFERLPEGERKELPPTHHLEKEVGTLKILFRPEVECRVVEEYGPESYTKREDGLLYFERAFTHESFMLCWVLSFGQSAEVLEPLEVREKISAEARGILEKEK